MSLRVECLKSLIHVIIIRIVLFVCDHLEGFKALFHRLKYYTFTFFKNKDLLHIIYTT